MSDDKKQIGLLGGKKSLRALMLPLFVVGIICSCNNTSHGTAPENFPPGFLWGVSTAAEQSEGGITNNDWYIWEQLGRTPQVGLADNFYNLYAVDFTDAQAMHLNAFRLTFEWSRIVPHKPADIYAPLTASDVDMNEVNHYHDVINSLIAHGMTPIVTLTHYTLPQWVDNPSAVFDQTTQTFNDGSLGGWTNTATAYAFANYAGFMAQQFSLSVRYWLTENEPMIDVLDGYVTGEFPPGYTNISDLTASTMPFSASARTVIKNLIMGHALAYHAIHAVEPDAKVSFTKNSIFTNAVTGNAASVSAADAFNHAYNLTFLTAVTSGIFDLGLTGTTFTEVHPEWAHTLDYIGVNYNNNEYVMPAPGILSPINAVPCDPTLGMGITIAFHCPAQNPPKTQGLTSILVEYARLYHLPILLTETGFGGITPLEKTAYIVQTAMSVHSAMARGVDMLGYLYWTLDYDYEWTSGYAQYSGLFSVDDFTECTVPSCGLVPTTTTDFTRIPVQPAVDVYSAIAAADSISPVLIDQYGH